MNHGNIKRTNDLRVVKAQRNLVEKLVSEIRNTPSALGTAKSYDDAVAQLHKIENALKNEEHFGFNRKRIRILKRLIAHQHVIIRKAKNSGYPIIKPATDSPMPPAPKYLFTLKCHWCHVELGESPWNVYLPEHRRTVVCCDNCHDRR
jgi:hypothetical protein